MVVKTSFPRFSRWIPIYSKFHNFTSYRISFIVGRKLKLLGILSHSTVYLYSVYTISRAIRYLNNCGIYCLGSMHSSLKYKLLQQTQENMISLSVIVPLKRLKLKGIIISCVLSPQGVRFEFTYYVLATHEYDLQIYNLQHTIKIFQYAIKK